MTLAYEANCDGLVGPTHSYGGLSPGNIASAAHGFLPSSFDIVASMRITSSSES